MQTRSSYDDFGRLLQEQTRLGNGPIATLRYQYDPLGRESAAFSGGRILATSTGSQVRYHVTDYLGSVRVVADAEGKRLEKCDYYPFGKRITPTADQPTTGNRYLFNGKEWQATGGVNLLDYEARMYDPNLGRWLKQDPIYQMQNPYSFCFSNPVNNIDRLGMWAQSLDGVVSENDEDIEELLRDMRNGTFKSYNYLYINLNNSNTEWHYQPAWIWYSLTYQPGGGSGGGSSRKRIAEKIAEYLNTSGAVLFYGGSAISLFGGGTIGVPMMAAGSVLSTASDVIYIVTDAIEGNYGLALFRASTTFFYFGGPLKLSKYVNGKSSIVLKVTFTVHEGVVDGVSNRIDDLHKKN